jgi:hypothetical protein
MSRPLSYSHVLATFVAEAARDARTSKRAGRTSAKADTARPRALHSVAIRRHAGRQGETLKPAA